MTMPVVLMMGTLVRLMTEITMTMTDHDHDHDDDDDDDHES